MTELLVIGTETGSVYEIRGNQVRRLSPNQMRRDQEWLQVLDCPPPVVGKPLLMVLNLVEDGKTVTFRETSPVRWIRKEELDDG